MIFEQPFFDNFDLNVKDESRANSAKKPQLKPDTNSAKISLVEKPELQKRGETIYLPPGVVLVPEDYDPAVEQGHKPHRGYRK